MLIEEITMSSTWHLKLITIAIFFFLMLYPYTLSSISWSRGPDLPLPRGGYQAAWFQGGLLIAGGTYWKNNQKFWTDKVSFYEPRSNHWSELESLPHPLAYGSMVQANQKLYLIGGSDEKSLSNDIYQLDGQGWVRIGEAPFKSVYSAAVARSTHIYIFGGGSSVTDLTKATNEAWMFNIKSRQWKKLEPIPGSPRTMHAAAIRDRYIYIFGGATQQPGQELINLDDAYRFDTQSERWSKLKSAPQPTRAWWATTGNDSLYLFGGYSENFLDQVYQYEPQKDEYRLVSKLPLPLCDTKFFLSEGVFYAASGEDKEGSRYSGTLIGKIK
jgi:N-acetylneuraminic acid mutarotase